MNPRPLRGIEARRRELTQVLFEPYRLSLQSNEGHSTRDHSPNQGNDL